MTKRLRSLLKGGALGLLIVSLWSVAFIGGPVSASPSQLSPWPTALHDSAHSSTASIQGPRHATVEWERSLGGNITPGPVVAGDGTIYIATNAGVLHALDPTTGADLWTFNGGSP
jgi:outer membrane protein assembly factor BamB